MCSMPPPAPHVVRTWSGRGGQHEVRAHCIWCPAGLAIYAGSNAARFSLQADSASLIQALQPDEFDAPGPEQTGKTKEKRQLQVLSNRQRTEMAKHRRCFPSHHFQPQLPETNIISKQKCDCKVAFTRHHYCLTHQVRRRCPGQ